MCALRHPRRDGPEPSAICRSRVRPHDATNVLVAVEHIVVVVSPCAHRWRACCRGSWAIDDELGELRGIAGAFAVVLHWPILDDFTSFRARYAHPHEPFPASRMSPSMSGQAYRSR